MFKNKLLRGALLIIASCLVFTSCGNKGGGAIQDNADITDDSVPESYSLPLSDGETITYSGPDSWYAPASLSKNLPVWQEVEKRLGIKIKWQVAPSQQWNTQMLTRIASGRELPDILGLAPWHNADIAKLADDGAIIPLNALINKYAPNIKKLLNENPMIRKQMTAPDGKIYSIDEFFEANEFYDTILIREDWLEKLGLSVPKTIDEYINVMKAFKEKDPNGNGKNDEIPLSVSEGYKYKYFASGFGLASPLQDMLPDKNGKIQYLKTTDNYKNYLSYLNRLYKEGLMDQQYAVGDTTKFESLVAQNIIGITVGGGDWADRFEAGLKSAGVKGAKYILIDPPCPNDGSQISLVKRQQLGGQIGISADCKNPELAIKIIDYLWATDEGNMLLHYGIEGKTYDMVDGKPVLSDFVMKNPDGLDPGSALRSIGAWPPLFDRQTREFMTAFYPEKAVKYYADNMAAGKYIDPFPKVLPTKEEVQKASEILTDIDTYQQEMETKFILGQEPISKFDDYKQKMKSIHLDEYIELRQQQYDRIMNSK